MERLEYVLTDGEDFSEIKCFTSEEYIEAQKQADKATDGNWYWVLYDDATMGRYLQPQSEG
ncbi:hypothetical protein HC931_25680 [Candidatus Gracilibacteria bacterium]|nr:hypothetical protein [Candidatus Gracilibacteria bacterium]NJM90021.1 hypothetical protein [Hydrococcus sp. RU_2_2]NJP21889.1 hypothetical protein [Hydrococcus sp. CRU_1_1]NJQ96955.1 hypothetical protein [Hydrococcus sp. CSU_1_8]